MEHFGLFSYCPFKLKFRVICHHIADNNFSQYEIRHYRTVDADCVTKFIMEPESLVQDKRVEMDEQVRKTECIAARHPIPVFVHLLSLNIDDRCDRHRQPNHIYEIEGDAVYFPCRGEWSHVTRSDVDHTDRDDIEIAIDTMKFAEFPLRMFGEIDGPGKHRYAREDHVNIHDTQPDRYLYGPPQVDFMT